MKEPNVLIIESDSNPGNIRVLLTGKLIISNAREIKRQLLKALNLSQNLEIVFKNVVRIDVPVLQLLIALQKTASTLGIKTSFDTSSNDYIQSVLKNTGLEEIFSNSKMQLNGI